MEILALLISGSVGAAMIRVLDNIVMWFLNRRASKKDALVSKRGAEEQELVSIIKSLRESQMALLDNRIRSSCKHHLDVGYVSIDELDSLHNLYRLFKELGGNKKLDLYVAEVELLPLK